MSKSTINLSNLFNYETLVHAISGAAGGFTAMAIFYPLDIVRSKYQVEDSQKAKNTWEAIKEIINEEGVEGLYPGLTSVLITLFASNFVYFYSFHGLRSALVSDGNHFALKDLGIGAIAGVINVLLTNPLWVVNFRMKMQGAKLKKSDEMLQKYPKYKNIFHGLYTIMKTEGAQSLWASTMPSLLLVSNPSLQFMFYEMLKRRLQAITGSVKLSATSILLLAATSKCLSTIITYPLQVIQSKLRYGSSDVQNKNMLEIMLLIIKKNGSSGLYKGMEAKLYQTVLTTALMFFCYEKIFLLVFQILNSSQKSS